MAYDREKIYNDSLKLIQEKNLLFVEDLIPFIPIVKSTFYEMFPNGSEQSDSIKTLLEENKVSQKLLLRSKWYESENPTIQIALMKIISSDTEAHRLNGTKTENHSTHTIKPFDINKIYADDQETQADLE